MLLLIELKNYLDDKEGNNTNSGINRDKLIDLLKEFGDPMDEKSISDCLEILSGDGNIKNLKENISSDYLYHDILKFEEVAENDEETTTGDNN